jgi:hypothetical protein
MIMRGDDSLGRKRKHTELRRLTTRKRAEYTMRNLRRRYRSMLEAAASRAQMPPPHCRRRLRQLVIFLRVGFCRRFRAAFSRCRRSGALRFVADCD